MASIFTFMYLNFFEWQILTTSAQDIPQDVGFSNGSVTQSVHKTFKFWELPLPEIDSKAPENEPSQREIHFPSIHFQGGFPGNVCPAYW